MGRQSTPDSEGKPKHESQDERDARMDQHYVFDRSEWPNLLAYVSAEKEALVREFLDWRVGLSEGKWREDLRRFEVHRFQNQLDAAPHGILAFAVEFEMYPNDPRFASLRKPKATLAGPVAKTPERAAREHEMPKARPTKREFQERLDSLTEQAREITGVEG